jgi:hypothetical protein
MLLLASHHAPGMLEKYKDSVNLISLPQTLLQTTIFPLA